MALKKKGTPTKINIVTEAYLDECQKKIEDGLNMILKEIRDHKTKEKKNRS